MEVLARQLTEKIMLTGNVEDDKKEIIQYGLELCISTLILFFSIQVLSLVLFRKLDATIFTIFFVPLRLFSGGFHASTYLKCYWSSLIIFSVTAVGAERFPVQNIVIKISAIMLGFILVYNKAPHINKNHPISERMVQINRKRLKIAMIINILLFGIVTLWNEHYGMMAFYTIIMVVLLFGLAESRLGSYLEKL